MKAEQLSVWIIYFRSGGFLIKLTSNYVRLIFYQLLVILKNM